MAELIPPMIIQLQLETSQLKEKLDEVEGHVKGLGETVKNEGGGFAKFGEMAKKGLEFVGVAATVGEIVSQIKEATKVAQEYTQVTAELDRTNRVVTGANKEQTESVRRQLDAMEMASSVSINQLAPSYENLVRVTKNSEQALNLQKVALDLSATKHISLAAASNALAKAHEGQTGALVRLMPNLKNSTDKIGDLEKQIKGAAQTAANTDPYKKMQVTWEVIQRSLGEIFLPLLSKLADWFAKLGPTISKVIDLIGKTLTNLEPVLDVVFKAFDKIVTVLFKALLPILPIITKLIDALAPVFTGLVGIIAKLITTILPPLINLIGKVLLPILTTWYGILAQYVIPFISKLADGLGVILPKAIGFVIKAFQVISAVLKPIWDGVLKPILDGLFALMGIKEVPVKVSVSAKTDPVSSSLLSGDYGNTGLTNANVTKTGTGSKTTKTKTDTLLGFITGEQAKIVAAQAKYHKAVSDAQDAYDSKVKDLTTARDDALAAAETAHKDKMVQIQKDYADKLQAVVQQSMDRLRSAFASATATDAGAMFKDLAANGQASADDLINSLKTRLASIKKLAEDAATLSGAGFSQTFIEQVVAQGPQVGDQMTQALIAATPEAQKQLQYLFSDTQTTSNTGMDALSKAIYDKSGLATDELKKLYSTTQSDLTKAMADEQASYDESVKGINDTFTKGMADAQDALTKALADAATALNTSLDAIDAALTKKLDSMKGKISSAAGLAAAKTSTQLDNAYVSTFTGYTQAQSDSMLAREAGQAANFTVVQNFAAPTVGPAELGAATTSAVKFDLPTLISTSGKMVAV